MSKFKTLPSIRVQKATDSFRDTVVDGLLPSPDEKGNSHKQPMPINYIGLVKSLIRVSAFNYGRTCRIYWMASLKVDMAVASKPAYILYRQHAHLSTCGRGGCCS